MKPTEEQQAIINYVEETDGLVLVDSVAGSGKTSLLVAIAKQLKPTKALYMAYNKAVATEAAAKFPGTVECKTTHALAYRHIVVAHRLRVGWFGYRHIKGKFSYEAKLAIVDSLRGFCLSTHLTVDGYALETNLDAKIATAVSKHLTLMYNRDIDCTHEFYLKLFHIGLAEGHINIPGFDFIALDEAGDVNGVTMEIFKLLPTKKRIAVGDAHQNIYRFNETINCFEVMEKDGKLFRLTQSFRVPTGIAKSIQGFCSKYLRTGMQFVGTDPSDKEVHTSALITRNNGSLIEEMIRCRKAGIKFKLTRKVEDIFKLPLLLCDIKHKGYIKDPVYRHLQSDINDWYATRYGTQAYPNPQSYVASVHKEDNQLQSAYNLFKVYGKAQIVEANKYANAVYKVKDVSYTLTTAHSSKGLEFDQVTIGKDLEATVGNITGGVLEGTLPENISLDAVDMLNLYYVATTRARKVLYGATTLNKYK